MSATQQLIDLAMRKQGLTSTYQLAKALNMSIQRVLNWVDGAGECDDDAAIALAKLAGVPAEYGVLIVASGRSKSPENRSFLIRAAERMAA